VQHSSLTLEERHDVERQFHDAKAGHGPAGYLYAEGGLDGIWDAFMARAGDLGGRTVLDFGCGEGWSSLAYAAQGATVHGFDISPESVKQLAAEAARQGLGARIHPRVMAAERLDYPDNLFDLVLGISILHHTELPLSGPEIRRVLKPGGRALFIEPLEHNWLLRGFRRLTPRRRTPTERPLTVNELRAFASHFSRGTYQGYYLLSILPQVLLLVTPSRGLLRGCLRLTERLDARLLGALPALQRYCRSVILEVVK